MLASIQLSASVCQRLLLELGFDVDLVAGTITVNQQMLYGKTGTPKGRTRRTVVMTETLERTLRSLDHIREGYVCRNDDGTPLRDGQALHGIKRACRKAKLPVQGWHWLRHGFGINSRAIP